MLRPAPLALSLLLLLPGLTAAQEVRPGYLPLEAAPEARVPAPAGERLARLARPLLWSNRATRGLVVPTTGRLRLGVVLVELADCPRLDVPLAGWEAALFSEGSYRRTPTGQPAFGSVRDYYLENSGGRLDVVGRVFDWVRIPATRAELEPRPGWDPTARPRLFDAALDALLAREPGALDRLDALAFVVSGDQAGRWGGVLWPHSSLLVHRGRPWRYYLMHAGSNKFEDVGVHCHELGHVLGLLDKYGLGSGTGLGQWCAMAGGAHGGHEHGLAPDAPLRTFEETAREVLTKQVEDTRAWLEGMFRRRGRAPIPGSDCAAPGAGTARPLHLCGVCKARLGWTRPRALDPRRTQRVFLTPVEDDPRQVARVLLDPQGRESVYLELRTRRGFDRDFPRPGLVVWRHGSPTAILRTFVPGDRLELVPAHGVRSLDSAHRAPLQVPFPAEGVDEVRIGGHLPGAWTVRLSGIALEGDRLYVTIERVD